MILKSITSINTAISDLTKFSSKWLTSPKSAKIDPNTLKYIRELNTDVFQSTTKTVRHFTEDEVIQAYRTYSVSPYINTLLRNLEPLSEADIKLIACLKQAINDSEKVSGTFVRGLTFNKKTPFSEENIKKFIFDNKGFTSTCPKANERLAYTFALGRESAIVEIAIKEPMPAYRASNYEVLFDINAFSADKFDLVKINENYYKLIQK